tara:strand:+ start:1361 stop:2629 length:1269 start_codon:yes stop_codon:yes gene_type:complete
MSNLLKEAIVDAQALREAALKNAEAAIVDKYSTEVRETLEQLLEQDELGLDEDAPAEGDASLEEDVEDVPLAATDGLSEMEGDNLNQLAEEGEDVEINLDLGALKEALQEMSMPSMPSMPPAPGARDDEEEDLDEDIEIEEAILAALLEDEDTITIEDPAAQDEAVLDTMEEEKKEASADELMATVRELLAQLKKDRDAVEDPKLRSMMANLDAMMADEAASELERAGLEEELEISDELIDTIVEKLTVDMGADLAGWAGRSAEDKKFQMEKEIAHRRSTDMEEELDTLKKAQEELVFENSQLSEQLDNLKRAAIEMKESLQGVNLSNARLLYTNRVLRNTSLNERQKDRIVEAISKSDSVTEARTIFNTLQSTVESAPNRGPKTLSEAISRPTSVIRASRAESTPKHDAFAERMKRLAGIK